MYFLVTWLRFLLFSHLATIYTFWLLCHEFYFLVTLLRFLLFSSTPPPFCNRHGSFETLLSLQQLRAGETTITSSEGGIGLAETQIALYFLLPGPMFTAFTRRAADAPRDRAQTCRAPDVVFSRYLPKPRWQQEDSDFSGRLWSLLLWRYSRPAWTRSCAACCR